MASFSRSLVGRAEAIATLGGMLSPPESRLVVIQGEAGVGKTALANHLMSSANRFTRKVTLSAYTKASTLAEDQEILLLASLARQLSAEVAPKMSAAELEDAIMQGAAQAETFVLLDNVDEVESADWFARFVSRWTEVNHQSLLVLTTRQAGQGVDTSSPAVRRFDLIGVDETAGLDLLAPLGDAFEASTLAAVVRALKGNPRQLLHLVSLSPKTEADLWERVKRLNEERDNVDELLQKVEGPVLHFLALGRANAIEFDERLLAWLWDRLVDQGAEQYATVKSALVAVGLLASYDEGRRLAVHPNDQPQLEKVLNQRLGKKLLIDVDYYLAEFYKAKFLRLLDGLQETEELGVLLGEYVHHSGLSNNLDGVFGFVFEPSMMKRIHHQGLSLVLTPALQAFADELQRRIAEADDAISRLAHLPESGSRRSRLQKTTRQLKYWQAEAWIELAHCHNDLSKHEACLLTLDRAAQQLSDLDGSANARHWRHRVNYLRGISHSDLGQSEECIAAYRDVVQQGLDDDRSLLALGYLAFELRFFDEPRAIRLCQQAIELSEKRHDRSLVAKNHCNLAQVLFFCGQREEADKHFRSAADICQSPEGWADVRELGRIKVHHSMVYIHRGDFVEAARILDEGLQANRRTGDRRRTATARALRSIVLFHADDRQGAKEGLAEAITVHRDLGDWRNAVMESLTYAEIDGIHNRKEALERARQSTRGREPWADAIAGCPERPWVVFSEYWEKHYRRRLLNRD
jgi:tetratricopeptide (TPR) repeat protein